MYPRLTLIRVFIALGALHAVVLFGLIPFMTDRVSPLYNQDRFTDGYDQIATNLIQGNGYRFYADTASTLMREPGYPVFVAALFWLFSGSFAAVKAANLALVLGTAWFTMRLARQVGISRATSLWPPVLLLIHPGVLIAESRGGVEILFGFLIVAFLTATYTAVSSSRWFYYAIAGALLGCAVLVRSTPILFPLFLFVYLWLSKDRTVALPMLFRNAAFVIVSLAIVLSPWIIRNYRLTHRFVPTASVLGISAHAGQYICTHFSEKKPFFQLDREAAHERSELARRLGYRFRDGYYQGFYSPTDELAFSSFLSREVAAEYSHHPFLCGKCMVENVFNFWYRGKSWKSTTANFAVQTPYLILALFGVVASMRNFRSIGLIVVFISYTIAVYIPILAQARYSVPLISLMSILVTLGLSRVLKSKSGYRILGDYTVGSVSGVAR